MGPRFVMIDRLTPMLLPVDVQDWVGPDHLVRFIVEALETLDLREAKINERGTGEAQYPPSMMCALLIYSYATGTFSSRQIERATREDLPTRFICGNTHPDHDTICTFRRENKALFEQAFRQVLEMAREMKLLKVGQITIAHDGTKVQANASKHSAVSYQRAGEMITQLEAEIKQLVAKAEAVDAQPLAEGLSIPQEIARRETRKAQLQHARQEIEKRAQERAREQHAEYEKKVAEREAKRQNGEKPRGSEPKAPSPTPEAKDQYNFTDPESRIMKAGNGQHFEQAYNAQASVEVESRLIVAQSLSDQPNDKQQLVPAVEAVRQNAGPVGAVLADSGYYSRESVEKIEKDQQNQPTGTVVYAAVEKSGHHRTVEDLEKKAEPPAPGPEAGTKEIMQHRLKTKEGRALYNLRKQTIEPVFGIIKQAMGFRGFSMRGKAKAALEWTLVTLSYNLRRLHCVRRQQQFRGKFPRHGRRLQDKTPRGGEATLPARRLWLQRLRLPRLAVPIIHLWPGLRNALPWPE
jgi:transposase